MTLLSGGGLHYDQESFGENIVHGCQGGDTFMKGRFSGGEVFLGNLEALDKKLDHWKLQLE